MCREALKGYLADATEIDAENIAAYEDKHQVTGITIPGARKIAEALDNVRAVDPACGSGAYLLGLLHEMVDLYQLLYSDKLKTDDRELHRIKLDIIEKCLYGVDKDPFATNIAMLRLWLSLSVDSAHPQSLPNLDFKIETGDSLTGPNPRDMPDVMRVSLDEEARQLAILKGRYMRARGEEKRSLRRLILSDQRRIATKLRSLSPGSIDWRVQFCEIFLSERDGFSVVVANPPYVNMVQMDAADPAYREQLRVGFSTARGGFDLFVPFMERGVQLLCRNGMFAYIVPNKLLSAEYSATLRHHFAQHMTLQSLADLSRVPVFSAAVYPVIALAQKKKTVNPISVIAYRAHATSLDNVELVELGRTPMYAATRANGLWSPLIDKVGDQDVGNITTKCQSLAELGDVSGAASVSEAYEWKDALVDSGERLYERHPERYAPFIVSGNVRRHFHTWRADNVQYIKRSYRMPVLDKHHHAISSRRVRQVESCKLIISGMSKRPTCVWDERGIAAGKSTVIIIPKKKDDGYFLAGVINSQPMSQIYKSLFGSLSLSGGYLRFGPPQIRALPIGLA
jgi:hypothetical protein